MEWQDIATAPKDGTRFTAIGSSKDYPGTLYAWPCRWFDNDWTVVSLFLENPPTHFSSLPKVQP